MTRDHEKYAPLLDAFIDAELSEEKMAEVGFHVAECPDCQRYTRDAARIREAFPGLDDVTVPDGFAESVMAALPTRKGAYSMENNNNLDPRNEAVPENADMNMNANPGVDNNNNNNNNAGNGGAVDFQNANNNNAGNNGDKNARNWRNIAVGLAACLAVLAAVQISGAFSPNRGATEKVGAAVAGGGAAAEQTVESTAEPADADEMNSAENAPEASEEETESAETDITTTAEESAADNANVSDLNSLDNAEVTQEVEEAQPEAVERKEDTSADNNINNNNETARSAESVQNTEIPEEDDLAPDPDDGEPDSILNGASLAEAEENDGGGENNAAENPVAEKPAYEAALTLPADAAPIFSAFEPLETASDGVWYAFSHDDYAAILEQLDGAGFVGNDIRIPRTDVIYVFVES